jgi:NTP pyrophosphatase (non-canonical NTP hydrolase)
VTTTRQPLSLNEYQVAALRTDDGKTISVDEMTVCCALGLTGEAGEVADMIKKWAYHGKTLDGEKLRLELGDVLWYLAVLAARRGMSLEDVAQANLDKLRRRYPEGFNQRAANARADEVRQ